MYPNRICPLPHVLTAPVAEAGFEALEHLVGATKSMSGSCMVAGNPPYLTMRFVRMGLRIEERSFKSIAPPHKRQTVKSTPQVSCFFQRTGSVNGR
jgi:hypothetical protein